MSKQTCKKAGQSDGEARNRGSRKLETMSGRAAIMALSLIFVCLSFTSSVFRCAEGATEQSMLQAGSETRHVVALRSKILLAMERKIDDPKLLEAARSKILLMDEAQALLLSELSDRMVADGASTVSSIALLLITALITLL
jgi:hypothetical protein